ncbi:unnamed protein product [Auanema sp. JU1783]|nr:unnamed protein product [Auanema sp. JU1783]
MTDFHHFDVQFICDDCDNDLVTITSNCDSEENIKCTFHQLDSRFSEGTKIACQVITISNTFSTEAITIWNSEQQAFLHMILLLFLFILVVSIIIFSLLWLCSTTTTETSTEDRNEYDS